MHSLSAAWVQAVTILSTMQERADFALVRGAWRLFATCTAAVLGAHISLPCFGTLECTHQPSVLEHAGRACPGYLIMLRSDLADNTYGLTALSVAGCAIYAHFFIGKLRYGAFMGSTAFLVCGRF